MQPIVVGVDFSPASGAAWAWACQLALVTGSELVAVTAVERSRGDRPHKPLDIIGHHVEEWLKEWVETQTDRRLNARSVVHHDDARRVLLDVGSTASASLIVVGRSCGDDGPGLLRFGSVAESLAHSTSRALAIVPKHVRQSIDTVVVGVDGSKSSDAAVAWCVPIAESKKVSILAGVIDRPSVSSSLDQRIAWRRQIREAVNESWARPLVGQARYFIDVVEPSDDVAGGLLALASRHRADALVVGSRPLGRLTNRRAGGVPMSVLHGARCPVVLVPASEARSPSGDGTQSHSGDFLP